MNLLLTGASGFLGRGFLTRAPGDWRILAIYRRDAGFPSFVAGLGKPNVVAAQCDLGDAGQAAALFREHGREWDACLHLAAKVDIPASVRDPAEDLTQNVVPLLNLLEGLHARRFVYFSSGAVYDGFTGEVQPDAHCAPTLPYAISKFACERYVQFFHERRRTIENYLIVRFFGAYGPYEAPHKIFTRLIRAFALEGKTGYTIYGDGRNLIDAMYLDDAVDAIHRMLAGSHWNDTVNLAGGRPRTIESLVCEVAEALGVRPVRIEKQGIANESNQFWGSTREMRSLFGFEARTSLPEGIRRFKEFLIAHQTV